VAKTVGKRHAYIGFKGYANDLRKRSASFARKSKRFHGLSRISVGKQEIHAGIETPFRKTTIHCTTELPNRNRSQDVACIVVP